MVGNWFDIDSIACIETSLSVLIFSVCLHAINSQVLFSEGFQAIAADAPTIPFGFSCIEWILVELGNLAKAVSSETSPLTDSQYIDSGTSSVAIMRQGEGFCPVSG